MNITSQSIKVLLSFRSVSLPGEVSDPHLHPERTFIRDQVLFKSGAKMVEVITDRKLVITGGAGFIGSNLSYELAPDNEVILLDNLFSGRVSNIRDLLALENVRFVEGSILDLPLLERLFEGVDYVFHHAAIASVQHSVKDPLRTDEVNVRGTLNVLLAAKKKGVKKVIYASSSSVYGDTPVLPKVEDMMPNPLSPYGVSKLAGEYYCKVFTEVYGLATVSLRYFNVYGPRQDPASEYAAVIPKFIMKVMNGEPPVIYGDGEQTRDFIFVKDVVYANILMAVSDATGVFNIARGKGITINELAHLIMDELGVKLSCKYTDPRPGDIRDSLADISRARDVGYTPRYELREGLKETIKWFRNEYDLAEGK